MNVLNKRTKKYLMEISENGNIITGFTKVFNIHNFYNQYPWGLSGCVTPIKNIEIAS